MTEHDGEKHRKSDNTPQIVVGIGASAGGIQAIRPLLSRLPQNAPITYLVLQHTDPARINELSELLASDCSLPLSVARDDEVLEPCRVYLIPPDRDCEFHQGRFHLQPAATRHGARHSIDHMFSSLAENYEERAAGVILSGSGMDGQQGMRAIRAATGITICQDPASAEYRSMPEAVIADDLADLILKPEDIADEIARILEWGKPRSRPEVEAEALEPVLRLLQRKTGFDFGLYKEGTVRRRLSRRMLINHCATLDEYRRLLVRSDSEAESLVQDLLISVTGFFRDAAAFQALERLLRPIVEKCDAGDAIRIWVPGCATGEEPYSIAIILAELLGERLGRIKVQIFATDVDSRAIREARQAIYRIERLRALPDKLLTRYFESWDGLYRLRRDLRDMVVFAEHDLIHDPPFTKLDLVSCRNVLIYLKRPLQEQLVSNFHYALKPDGLLLLGDSESADRITELFTRADEDAKIYRRLEIESTPPRHLYRRPSHAKLPPEMSQRTTSPESRLQRTLVNAYAPPCALVNAQQNIVYVRGDLSRYIRLQQGEINVNLVEMAANPDIRVEMHLLLNRVLREHVRVSSQPILLPDNDPPRLLTIVGLPGDDDHALVVFEERDAPSTPAGSGTIDTGAAQRIAELEKELAATREHLHANIEDLEAANEELQSTNEEFQSTSEELQSTLEEHQTTNEELQSTNEELNTVNDELIAKSDVLETANSDLQSILDNVASAIIVLDRDLRLTRYSSASRRLFDLSPASIGRPFINIGANIDLGTIASGVREAVHSHKPLQTEINLDTRIFDVQIIPRMGHKNDLSSLVIVFTRETEKTNARKHARLLATMVRDSNDAVIVRDLNDRIMTWNAAAERLLGYPEAEARGQLMAMLIPAELKKHADNRQEELLAGKGETSETVTLQTRDGEQIQVAVTSSLLLDTEDQPFAISTIIRDITEQQRKQDAIQAARDSAERANLAKSRFLAAASHDLRQPLQSLSLYLAAADGEVGSEKRQEIHKKWLPP